MIIFKTAAGLQTHLQAKPGHPATVGFVPTMGALHAGHLSLIAQSKREQTLTVCSIFVNPTQFNDPADFAKYPVTIEEDIRQLELAGCDILFLPSVAEIYPEGTAPTRHYELGELENLLEGEFRPGHFQGVCQVVQRLLEIVQPAHLYLGQKDYQQCMVLRKMIELTELPVQLHIGATVREDNGLAMSSRNMRLSATEKEKALSIYRQMQMIKDEMADIPLQVLKEKATLQLLADGFDKVDYVQLAEAKTLHPLVHWTPGTKAVILVAAFMGPVRLIDNLVVGGK